MILLERVKAAVHWAVDFIFMPEGNLPYDDESKSGYAPFAGLLAFIVTQNGAVAIGERLEFLRSELSLVIFAILSAGSLFATLSFLRLRMEVRRREYHYFDRGSILFGKFVLYISVVGTVATGVAYAQGWFSPNRPTFTDASIPMLDPMLLELNRDNGSIVDEGHDRAEGLTLDLFATAFDREFKRLVKQHFGEAANGDTYVWWSRSPFREDFNDFTCTLPKELNPRLALPFLYVSYPVRGGSKQSAYRLLHFVTKEEKKVRQVTPAFSVRSPRRGDRIVIIFGMKRGDALPCKRELESRASKS